MPQWFHAKKGKPGALQVAIQFPPHTESSASRTGMSLREKLAIALSLSKLQIPGSDILLGEKTGSRTSLVVQGFKNWHTNAGDTGLIPGLGRFHMLWDN